jgi:hypothetical protein
MHQTTQRLKQQHRESNKGEIGQYERAEPHERCDDKDWVREHERLSREDMKDGHVLVSHDGLSQWHCQVIDDSPELDMNPIMVMTGLGLDPDNIIAWIRPH